MKLLIIGDSHGNIANIKHVMGFGKNVGVRAVIHCGDWNNIQASEIVNSYGVPVYGVLGNADISAEIKDKFKDFLEIKLDNKKIAVVHKINDIYKHKYDNWDIVFCGHYHSQSESSYRRQNGDYYRVVRPGALESSINFAVYDTDSDRIEFLHD